MKLAVITIVKNGMPYLERIMPSLSDSGLDFRWLVAEGTAMPGGSTNWCRRIEPGLSTDGTTEYLRLLEKVDSRVTYGANREWPSKDEMVNWCVRHIKDPCVLLQMDADEIWTPEALRALVNMFDTKPDYQRAYMKCRFWVGPDRYLSLMPNDRNHWLRAWRFRPGMRFDKHEPPVLSGNQGPYAGVEQTQRRGIVFEHYSYATREQVKFKQDFYGYEGAVEAWERLQAVTAFPVRLRDFFHWSHPASEVVKD